MEAVENGAEFYPVKLIVALTFKSDKLLSTALEQLQECYGSVETTTPVFVFDHTRYYEEEMGTDLKKQFLCFRNLIDREELISIKREAVKTEQMSAESGKRRINIDPAYLELAKLVVASTKNFSHRIFLGRGIYGDVQMMYKQGRFIFNEWTYPDYKSEVVTGFLLQARAAYYEQLKELS